jgi:hypothetical protein
VAAIGSLIYPELTELKEAIEARMEEMRREGVPALRERFADEAAALGVTLEEVVDAAKKKRPAAQGACGRVGSA